MHKIILMFLLAVMSSSTAAEWIKVAGASNADIYVDPATIRRMGNIAVVVALYDLKTAIVNAANDLSYLSQKSQSEYDCVERKWRMVEYSWYSNNMGEGKMVESVTDSYAWAQIPPRTGADILWRVTCGKQ